MAQQTVNNGDSGLIARSKINSNDAELYSIKVDKVAGKSLSDENYTLAEKNKLAGIETGAQVNQTDAEIKTQYEANADTNAFTDAEKTNLSANTAHRTSDGTDHSYINQNVTTIANPEFAGLDYTPQAVSPVYKKGRSFYDETAESYSFFEDIAGVPPIRNGRVLRSRVQNNETFTITKGQVVKIVGVTGTNPIVELAQANNIEDIRLTIGIAMHNIISGQLGKIAVFDTIIGVNTSGTSVNDLIYLDPDNAGGFTNIEPKAPDYAYPIGFVSVVDNTNGVIGVRVSGFSGTDTSTNIEGALNGIITKKPLVTFVVDGGVTYADISNEDSPTKNLPLVMNSKQYFLNTTSGSGAGGSARIGLTNGTINAPIKNYIYTRIIGDTPTLESSTIYPTGDYAIIGWCSLLDSASTLSDGVFSWQRNNNSVDNGSGNGNFNYIAERLRLEGAKYVSGVNPTVVIDNLPSPDSVNITTSIGVVSQLHIQTFNSTTGSDYYIINHPTEPFKKISDLNEIDVLADGNPISDNQRIGINIFGTQNSNGVNEKILISLPNSAYVTDDGAITDTNNYAVTGVPSGLGISLNTFRICRLVLRYDTQGGVQWTNILGEGGFQDERGFQLGLGGSGGTSGLATTEFSDGSFNWFNSVDPTKTASVDLNQITAGQNRTLTIQDKDGTVALLSDIGSGTVNKVSFNLNPSSSAVLIDSNVLGGRGIIKFKITGYRTDDGNHVQILEATGLGSTGNLFNDTITEIAKITNSSIANIDYSLTSSNNGSNLQEFKINNLNSTYSVSISAIVEFLN